MPKNRMYIREIIAGRDDHFIAEVDKENGEVIGCQPVGVSEMNTNIDACIEYLQKIKSVIMESRSARPV